MTTSPPTPPTDPHAGLITIAEAARRLGKSKGTLYMWHSRHINPELFVHINTGRGRRPWVRIDPHALAAFMTVTPVR